MRKVFGTLLAASMLLGGCQYWTHPRMLGLPEETPTEILHVRLTWAVLGNASVSPCPDLPDTEVYKDYTPNFPVAGVWP